MEDPAILLPEPVKAEAITLAQQLGISLSDLYTDAIASYLRKHNRQSIFTQLNQVYPEQPSELDPLMAELSVQVLAVEGLVDFGRLG
jgi:hypothetical protein